MSMELTEEEKDGARIVGVAGELDPAVAEELRAAIGRGAGKELVLVDLATCEFIDSTAIAGLVAAGRDQRAEGRRLPVLGATAQVRRVLELTGLDRRGFVFEDGVEAA